MKNMITDYAALLISGYMPIKKSYTTNRRPFNPGNPNEFESKPAAVKPGNKEEHLIAATGDDNGDTFNTDNINTALRKKKTPVPIHIF